jgi:putative membrane protein
VHTATHMKKLTLIAALCLATPMSAAFADDNMSKSAKMADADVQIASDIHHANKGEVDMANLALKQGTKAVKDYANTMVKDHNSNDKDLMALAKRHNTSVPDKKMDDEEMMNMKKLITLKGTTFDKAYIDMMVDDHTKVLAKLSAGSPSDGDLKTHVETTKTAVQRHLDMAKQLQTSSPTASK